MGGPTCPYLNITCERYVQGSCVALHPCYEFDEEYDRAPTWVPLVLGLLVVAGWALLHVLRVNFPGI